MGQKSLVLNNRFIVSNTFGVSERQLVFRWSIIANLLKIRFSSADPVSTTQ